MSMSEIQPPEAEEPQPAAVQPHAEQSVPQEPEGPQVPEAAPTDFRRNIYLFVIILAVVVLAWVVSLLYKPSAPAAETSNAPAPAATEQTAQQQAPSGQPAPQTGPSAEPVAPIYVVGSNRVLIAASPPQLVKRGQQTFRTAEETFDVTQRAPSFDPALLMRMPGRWAGQRPVVMAAGKLQELFQPAVTVKDLQPTDRAITVTIGDETHVYPVDLMSSLAGVIDLVGGRQVFVTWSPVTQLARCLDLTVDGKAVQWQDAGLVYRGNEVLIDPATGSLWDSFGGDALSGSMAGKVTQDLIAEVWPWADWVQAHATSNVLVLPGDTPDKESAQRMESYLSSPSVPIPLAHAPAPPPAPTAPAATGMPATSGSPVTPMAPTAPSTPAGPALKSFVLGIAVGKESRAYDLGALFSEGKKELKDSVGGKDFEITVTSPRTAIAASDGKPADASVMLYFGWKEAHPDSTVYGAPAPAAAPAPQPVAPMTPVK